MLHFEFKTAESRYPTVPLNNESEELKVGLVIESQKGAVRSGFLRDRRLCWKQMIV